MEFNSSPSYVMHIDINSCFASIEQQANPFLRGKPLVVAAFNSSRGCILAASVEAKKMGIKTGMRVFEGLQICSGLKVLSPDPWKYRNIHLKLRELISEYTEDFVPKSIDEFSLNMEGYPVCKTRSLKIIAQEIKDRIKSEIGEWLTVSVGIAPNRYLAKVAAGLHKPDGLDEINKSNFLDVYSHMKLTDLTGIKTRNAARLNLVGIYSVLDFYNAPVWKLKAAFHSINGLYWHMRLGGFEIDRVTFGRKSYGNSVALGANIVKIDDLSPILARLTEKMSGRLRGAGYVASGIHLTLVYKDGSFWNKSKLLSQAHFDSRDFYKAAFRLLIEAGPKTPVLNIAVSCFGLNKNNRLQLGLFENIERKEHLVRSIDFVNKRWGELTIGSARSFDSAKIVLDRIAFGGIKELEEFTLRPGSGL